MCDIFILYRLNPHTYHPVKGENNWGLSSNKYSCTHKTEGKWNGLLFYFGILIDFFFSSIFLPHFVRAVGLWGVSLYMVGVFLDRVGGEGRRPFFPDQEQPVSAAQYSHTKA